MPPKRKCPANKKAEECAVCCQKVTKGEDEALFCEGKCQKWFHRYCAGVSVAHFQDLSTASAPFLCVMCYQESHGVVLEELRATVTALTDEVKELRAALQRVEVRGSDVLPSPPTKNNEPWHTATRRKKRSKKGNNAGKSEAGATAHGTKQHTQSTNVQRTVNQQASVNPSKKELVPGARRIWGTMRTCTVPTVVNSITRLTDVGDSVLRVKRKFKTGTDGKVTRWWYIIHAEEACLQQLESEWQKVELQTSWKLEPCYRYLESDEQTPLSGEQCPLPESESEVAPLDPAPAVLSQHQETQSQREESE